MSKYKVTGIMHNGRRFNAIHTDNLRYALGINLWNGSVWEQFNGHWKRIKVVYN